MKEYAKAILDFGKAIELFPKNPEYIQSDLGQIYHNRGVTESNMELNEAAIADFGKAIEIAPDWAQPYYERGRAYKSLKNRAKAIADFEKALSLAGDHADFAAMVQQAIDDYGN